MKSSYNRKHSLERLDYYYQVINTTVLSKQNAASGLIPASVAITVSRCDLSSEWSVYLLNGIKLDSWRLHGCLG